jgi:hypothetical protein
MGVLAELELFHSRPIAPTRRVALGHRNLPVEPPPGFGGVLLGGVVAAHIAQLDPDLHPDLLRLTIQLEEGRRIPQPRLRYRLQTDRVGLSRTRFRLLSHGDDWVFDFEQGCTAAQAVLGAVYAAGATPPPVRHVVMATVRRGMRWAGPLGAELIAHLAGYGAAHPVAAFGDPVAWALGVLGFELVHRNGEAAAAEGRNGARGAASTNGASGTSAIVVPPRVEIQRRFRDRLRQVHPDHGGETADAARRIAELAEARRILIGR